MKHGLGQISGSFSRGVESLKKSAQSRGGSTSVYCKGVRQLDNYGYEKFNLEDGGEEIFISRHSEKSMFNEDDSILIRATDGNFVTQPDTTKEIQLAEETVVESSDMRGLFGNVPVSDTPCEFHGVVGTVDAGRVVPTPVDNKFLEKMAKPAPGMQKLDMDQPAYKEVTIQDAPEAPVEAAIISNSFLERMVKVTPAVEEPEIVEIAEEMPEDAPLEMPEMESVEEPAVAETPAEIPEVIEAPVENGEFFIGTEEETVEAPVDENPEELECDNNSLDDDYSMMFPDYEESEAVAEVIATAAVLDTVEAPVEQTVEAPVEEPEVAEMPVEVPEIVEAPVEQTVEAPVEGPEAVAGVVAAAAVLETVEAPVEEPIVVEPRIAQTVEVPEMPAGLYIEGNEPSNVAVASAGDAVQMSAATVTGGTAVEPPSNNRAGLDADGEALPPISDPVVTRPRSVRFRFANGVLMSVDSKTEGSQEGPARPLE